MALDRYRRWKRQRVPLAVPAAVAEFNDAFGRSGGPRLAIFIRSSVVPS